MLGRFLAPGPGEEGKGLTGSATAGQKSSPKIPRASFSEDILFEGCGLRSWDVAQRN